MSDLTINQSPSLNLTLEALAESNAQTQKAQQSLESGLSVSSAIDNPLAFSASQSLYGQASSLLGSKSAVDQGVSALGASLATTKAVGTLLNTLKGILESAEGAPLAQRVAATQAFEDIGQQIGALVGDSSFQGLNLLNGSATQLTLQTGAGDGSVFTIQGFNLTATAGGSSRALFTAAGAAFNSAGQFQFSNIVASGLNIPGTIQGFSALDVQGIDGTVSAQAAAAIFAATSNRIDQAISKLNGVSASLGSNVAILQTTSDFQSSFANTLQTGGDALTLTDLNASAAQTQSGTLRQQLGVQSIALQNRARKGILQLLGGGNQG